MVNDYSIWLLPKAAQLVLLTKIVGDLAERFGSPRFIPHVTIQGDLTIPFGALKEALQGIANEHTSQNWPVASIDGGEHFFRSLYVRFDKYPAYVSLKQSMRRISRTADGLSLFPHLSLAYGLTDAQKSAALFSALRQSLTEPFCFDRMVIARSSKHVPIADWECLTEFALGDAMRCTSSIAPDE